MRFHENVTLANSHSFFLVSDRQMDLISDAGAHTVVNKIYLDCDVITKLKCPPNFLVFVSLEPEGTCQIISTTKFNGDSNSFVILAQCQIDKGQNKF